MNVRRGKGVTTEYKYPCKKSGETAYINVRTRRDGETVRLRRDGETI